MTLFARRMCVLLLGFLFCGFGIAAMVKAKFGLGPWDIFHQGLHFQSGLSMGTCTVLVGAVILLLWIPFRQKPGIGTVLNMLLIGPSVDFALYILPDTDMVPLRAVYIGLGLPFMAFGTALYLSTAMGAGPRDGLMLALTRKFGLSVRLARTLIECSAFLGGWLMGGAFGFGSIYFALLIGPAVQFIMEKMQHMGLWHRPLTVQPQPAE